MKNKMKKSKRNKFRKFKVLSNRVANDIECTARIYRKYSKIMAGLGCIYHETSKELFVINADKLE